jgi:hypothetical protein
MDEPAVCEIPVKTPRPEFGIVLRARYRPHVNLLSSLDFGSVQVCWDGSDSMQLLDVLSACVHAARMVRAMASELFGLFIFSLNSRMGEGEERRGERRRREGD